MAGLPTGYNPRHCRAPSWATRTKAILAATSITCKTTTLAHTEADTPTWPTTNISTTPTRRGIATVITWRISTDRARGAAKTASRRRRTAAKMTDQGDKEMSREKRE